MLLHKEPLSVIHMRAAVECIAQNVHRNHDIQLVIHIKRMVLVGVFLVIDHQRQQIIIYAGCDQRVPGCRLQIGSAEIFHCSAPRCPRF